MSSNNLKFSENNFIFNNTNKETLAETLAKDLSGNIEQLLFMNETERIKTLMNILMKAERELHLQNYPNDKGNGFRTRKLNTSLGQIQLNVPGDRDGDFRPAILPPHYQRFDDSYLKLLHAGINNFYSNAGIKNYLNNLDLPYSQEQVKKLSDIVYEEFKLWQKRELPEDVAAIFIDGFHTELFDEKENKVVKAVVYLVIGIDFEGNKDLYSVEFITGSENKEAWLVVLNNLINRGLKRPLIVVSDDFTGIIDAVKTVFPNAFHQLCWTHFRRNIKRNMGKKDAKIMQEAMEKIKLENNFDAAKNAFIDVTNNFKKKYNPYINHIQSRVDHILCFMRLDHRLRKYFYTTNIVESFNNNLSTIEKNSGGFFRSKKMLELNCYIKRNQLKSKKWRNPAPLIKANIYYLIQLSGTLYNEPPKLH